MILEDVSRHIAGHEVSRRPQRIFIDPFLVTFLNLLFLNKIIEYFLFFHFGTWIALLI